MTTTILEPQQGTLRLGTDLDPRRSRNRNADAWKQAVGSRQVAARFTVLADAKPRWDTFGASVVMQAIVVAFLFTLPLLFPQQLASSFHYEIMPLATPQTEVLLPPPPPKIRPRIERPAPKPEPVETPEPPKVARLIAPKPVAPLPPKPKQVDVITPEIKPVFDPVKLETKTNEPKRPREEVKTGLLTTGSAAVATVNLPLNKVQTGGFGDPNGLPGPGDPSKRANINRKGSPDLPNGPGYGNGTGGANGVRGTVASTGFGSGIAIPPPGGSGGRRGTVQTTGFSDASAAAEAPKKKAASAEGATDSVVILDKPRPAYTQEARNLKIEGDVVVEVVFLASGQVQVNRVVSGLGHGLDESAVRAAQQIKFRPAKREGQAVDFPARVRIEFRLAY